MADEASRSDRCADAPPVPERRCYLLIHSVAKPKNIGNIVRSAAAFGVHEVVLAGGKKHGMAGSFGTAKHLSFRGFPKLQPAVQYLRDQGATILGIEIGEGARRVQEHPFAPVTAFVMGNEGHGLTEQEAAVCDGLVYIPHYGAGTASLNVTVATSIVLHHFGSWANLPETPFHGQKMDVAYVDTTQPHPGGDEVAEERAQARKELASLAAEATGQVGTLFDDDGY